MRIRGLTLSLSVLGALLTSCTSTYGLTVSWTFKNGGSCDGAGIDQVRITIPGEPLQQSVFDCRLGQVLFTDFYPGSYTVTVDALDATIPNPPTPLWTGTAPVDVRTSTQVVIALEPVPGAPNAVTYLSWTVDPATGDANQIPRCGQWLDKVAIYVDNTANGTYDCTQGIGGGVVISPYLTAGQHQIDLVLYSSQEGVTSYAESGPLQILFTSGQASSQTVPLHWDVGGLQVAWAPYASVSDWTNDIRQTCAQAGITDLVLGFPAHDTFDLQAFSLGASCNASVILDNAYAGTFAPYIDACGASTAPGTCTAQTAIYQEDPTRVNPPTVTVQPGRFFQASQPAPFQVFIPLFHL